MGANHAHFEKQFWVKLRDMSHDDIIGNLSTSGSNDVSVTFLYFSSGYPKKGEYSGLTNAEKCISSTGRKTTQTRKRNMKHQEKRYGEQN